MWQFLLNRFAADPSWVVGSGIIMFLMIVLVVWSFFRNIRQLGWFSMAGILSSGVYFLGLQGFPIAVQWLANYRSDWALLSLVQNIQAVSLLWQFLIYFVLYNFLALALIVVLGIWSLLTFRWQRWRIIFRRAIAESWMVFLFSLTAVIFNVALVYLLKVVSFDQVANMFQMMSFVFCLQLFLRLIDTAYLHTPKLFMEFVYATGLWFLFLRFTSDWAMLISKPTMATGLDQALFFNQLFSFFLAVLIIGILAHFFIRALFASAYFLEVLHRKTSVLFVWTSRLFLAGREASYAQQRILMGVLAGLVSGFVFLVLVFQGWYLALIPAFFLGYFILFYLLDRQEDARVRGDMVDKRIESAVSKVFFA